MQRYLQMTLVTLLFAAVAVVSANAQTIPAEDDTWITGSGTFSSSFTVTPILTFTNVNNSSELPHTVNCSDPSATCSFPMGGSGNWVQTSSTGFDPQSQGIPIVPSGVQIGSYTTVGRPRFGGIQVGCGGTKSTGYGCGQNNELHGAGSIGQQIHGTKPPNDCATNPQPAPSPTPVPIGTVGAARVRKQPTTGAAISTDSTQALCVSTATIN